ncbi:Palmdelphin [Channa argus]|uniref:Palmdelphin n=1 Tax=Channa argus TaxID=215402 RepID=A0A6G1Q8B9_CHAAH|nr:Palmdelphin [Channa argus]
MEESGLLKERFQAITEKHRIQKHIRQKKLELDQEKLKLQHLKKTLLREQWLLQDSVYHNAKQQSLFSDQQQTRALQLNIHRIEMEILSLEREESTVSTNESFILNRLKAVEKSPEQVIKEAQVNFVSEPLQVPTLIPKSLSLPVNNHTEPNRPRKTLFAMEINVSKTLQAGENTVLSTTPALPEELNQHIGQKFYDDVRKCVYALNAEEGSHDPSCISELSAYEVEQLVRTATVHHLVNNSQHPSRESHYLYTHKDEARDLGNQARQYGAHVFANNIAEKKSSCRYTWHDCHYDHSGSHCSNQDEGNNHKNPREGHHFGKHKVEGLQYGKEVDGHYRSCLVRNSHSFQEDGSVSHHTNGIISSNSSVSVKRPNACCPPSATHQEIATGYQQQLSDYVTGDKKDCHAYSKSYYHSYRQPENSHNHSTALYSGATPLERLASPYTILNTLDATEPITAIFMGFQAAQDDSRQSHEFTGSLKAELVIIEDSEQNSENIDIKEVSNSHPSVSGSLTGSPAIGSWGCVEASGARQKERQVGPGIREIHKKQKFCCAVC